MIFIKDDKGEERIAYAKDFNDTTVTLTPAEWNEITKLLQYGSKKLKPDPFCKHYKTILDKLQANPPTLKEGRVIISDTSKDELPTA